MAGGKGVSGYPGPPGHPGLPGDQGRKGEEVYCKTSTRRSFSGVRVYIYFAALRRAKKGHRDTREQVVDRDHRHSLELEDHQVTKE